MKLRSLVLTLALFVTPTLAFGQGLDGNMPRGEGINIKGDVERKLMTNMLCVCGCPRDVLATCPCGIADGYRAEVRAKLAAGLTPEQIEDDWVKRYGPQALAVPKNTGANRLLYLVPLLSIAGMAAFVVMLLRRFRKASDLQTAPAPAEAGGKPDKYDEKLDDELKQLDKE